MPEGYRTITVQRQVGTGQAWFHTAVDRLISWEMHRRAGLLVAAERLVVRGGVAMLTIRVGPWWIDGPVRVVDVIEEPAVRVSPTTLFPATR